MPKRPNPFGECSPLQLKTHIGKKEVDMGIGMQENMKTVYERTKSLLFQGSKKPTDCVSCNPENDWSSMDTREDLRPLPGQMRLDAEGHLCAKEPPQTNGHNVNGAVTGETEMESSAMVESSDVRPPQTQLIIDASGKLCSQIDGATQLTSSGCRICHSCNRPIHITVRQCAFCDKMTCTNCIQQCNGCQGLYCRVCCVLNYDDCTERPFCLQCSQ